MAEGAVDVTLELTLLSIDGLKDSTFLGNAKPLAEAWVDPKIKRSTKAPCASSRDPSPQRLHLPLQPQSLNDPDSSLTIQILSSRLRFGAGKPIAAATVPLSSVPVTGETLTLPLRRPSGRADGLLRVAVRFLWCFGAASFGAGVPVEGLEFFSAQPAAPPTAPPMPEDVILFDSENEEADLHSSYQLGHSPYYSDSENSHDGSSFGAVAAEVEGDGLRSSAPLTADGHSYSDTEDSSGLEGTEASADIADTGLEGTEASADAGGTDMTPVADRATPAEQDGNNAWRSFLMGLASGTLAAVLVGVAGLAEG